MRVYSHSGRAADERPVRFETGGVIYVVVEVMSQWRTPEEDFFKVRANDGRIYVLRHVRAAGEWTLESVNSRR